MNLRYNLRFMSFYFYPYGKVKHRTIKNLGLFDDDQVPYIKAAFAKKKPRLVYDD